MTTWLTFTRSDSETDSHCESENSLDHRDVVLPSTAFDAAYADEPNAMLLARGRGNSAAVCRAGGRRKDGRLRRHDYEQTEQGKRADQ